MDTAARSLPSLPAGQASVAPATVRHARPGAQHARLREQALELLRQAVAAHPGAVVQSSSLGAEDMVLTDLIQRHGLDIRVATLDTGALHPQTLQLMQRVRQHYGMDIEVWQPPRHAVVEFVARNGSDAMYRSVQLRHACCALRKLEPLGRMLQGRSAWVTGLRREQSAQRGTVQARQVGSDGRAKYSPLLDWSLGDVWQYIADLDVPYNPLHDEFYPSIGCAPCTRAVTLGEEQRAGRWWWERDGEKECGLHGQRPPAQADVPAAGSVS